MRVSSIKDCFLVIVLHRLDFQSLENETENWKTAISYVQVLNKFKCEEKNKLEKSSNHTYQQSYYMIFLSRRLKRVNIMQGVYSTAKTQDSTNDSNLIFASDNKYQKSRFIP